MIMVGEALYEVWLFWESVSVACLRFIYLVQWKERWKEIHVISWSNRHHKWKVHVHTMSYIVRKSFKAAALLQLKTQKDFMTLMYKALDIASFSLSYVVICYQCLIRGHTVVIQLICNSGEKIFSRRARQCINEWTDQCISIYKTAFLWGIMKLKSCVNE